MVKQMVARTHVKEIPAVPSSARLTVKLFLAESCPEVSNVPVRTLLVSTVVLSSLVHGFKQQSPQIHEPMNTAFVKNSLRT